MNNKSKSSTGEAVMPDKSFNSVIRHANLNNSFHLTSPL